MRSDREYVPAEQVVQVVLELVSCLPAAHVMQELRPELGWYLPDAQVVHEVRVWLAEDW